MVSNMEHIGTIAQGYKLPAGNNPAKRPGKPAYSPPERATLAQLDTTVHPMIALAVQSARKWQERRRQNPNASLVLVASGVDGDINRTGYGCGKTHIARSILWSICLLHDDGTPVAPVGKFHTAADLLELLSEGGEHEIAALLGSAPILVIDDVGSEGVLQFIKGDPNIQTHERQARYFRAVDYCYRKGIAVIITSNLSFPALSAHVGGRCWSRLMEMAPAGFMLDLTGVPDWRRVSSGR